MRHIVSLACVVVLCGCSSPEPVSTESPSTDSPKRSPEVIAMRAKEIQATADAMRAEAAAHGDWDKWLASTAEYRLALKDRLDALEQIPKPPLQRRVNS